VAKSLKGSSRRRAQRTCGTESERKPAAKSPKENLRQKAQKEERDEEQKSTTDSKILGLPTGRILYNAMLKSGILNFLIRK
jgi:hypothetical protein